MNCPRQVPEGQPRRDLLLDDLAKPLRRAAGVRRDVLVQFERVGAGGEAEQFSLSFEALAVRRFLQGYVGHPVGRQCRLKTALTAIRRATERTRWDTALRASLLFRSPEQFPGLLRSPWTSRPLGWPASWQCCKSRNVEMEARDAIPALFTALI